MCTCLTCFQGVDVSKEHIYLDCTKDSMTADELSEEVPVGCPGYHFFLFKHSYEGDYQESIGTCVVHTVDVI